MAKTKQVRARYSRKEDDLLVHWRETDKSDANIVLQALKPLLDELRQRGYDPRTIKFRIEGYSGVDN